MRFTAEEDEAEEDEAEEDEAEEEEAEEEEAEEEEAEEEEEDANKHQGCRDSSEKHGKALLRRGNVGLAQNQEGQMSFPLMQKYSCRNSVA